jgi:hypothetical protein
MDSTEHMTCKELQRAVLVRSQPYLLVELFRHRGDLFDGLSSELKLHLLTAQQPLRQGKSCSPDAATNE